MNKAEVIFNKLAYLIRDGNGKPKVNIHYANPNNKGRFAEFKENFLGSRVNDVKKEIKRLEGVSKSPKNIAKAEKAVERLKMWRKETAIARGKVALPLAALGTTLYMMNKDK